MKLNVPFKIAGLTGLLLFMDSATLAEGGSTLPGAALPEVVSQQLTKPAQAPAQTLPPLVTKPKQEASPLAKEAQKIKFKLNAIILEGNHLYSTQQLEPLYKNRLNKTITVADLFDIVQDITNYYRNNGYVLSRALLPPQHVKNGIVHVQIVEGYIGQIDVSGNPHGAKCLVYAFGKRIRSSKPLDIHYMEKYLLIANEIPHTQVKAVLSPSKSKTGAADLTLLTENSRFNGYLSYDDFGTRYIGEQQITANLGFNSFINSGDSTQFTMTKTPRGAELTYFDVNYNTPISDDGKRWLFGSTTAHTRPQFVLTPQKIDGLNNNYYTTFSYPIVRTRTTALTLRGGFNYMDSHVTSHDADLYTDHIRSLDLGFTLNISDSWYGANMVSMDARQGLPILGYTSNTDVATALTSRPGGRGDYTKLAVQLSRLQAIRGPLSIYGYFTGQASCNPLLASEQFAFGGGQIGRGYDVAEIIGDKGIAATGEVHYDMSLGNYLQSVQLYAFYDAGVIWNFLKVGGVPFKQSAQSTGGGMRFNLTKYVSGNVFWAQPLTKQVLTQEETRQITVNGQTTNHGNGSRSRVFFSIAATF